MRSTTTDCCVLGACRTDGGMGRRHHRCHALLLYLPQARSRPPHRTMAQRDWMGSMILEDWLQASAKRVVEL